MLTENKILHRFIILINNLDTNINPMKIKYLIYVLIPVLLAGCYPQLDSSVTDADTVITFFDDELRENNGYLQYKTYILPDTIIHIIDEENPENNVPISREYDEQILSDVRRNMAAYGYTEMNVEDLDPGNLPDLIILVEAVALKNWVRSIYCWPPFWGWGGWWGGWPGYPGWGGCGSTLSSFSTGSIYVNMFDPLRFNQDTDAPEINEAEVWLGVGNGVLSSGVDNEARVEGLIDQAFRQSPYLNQNQ